MRTARRLARGKSRRRIGEVIAPQTEFSAERVKGIDEGEAAAIALAFETEGATLLIDDLRGRKLANELGVVRIGILGLLALAKNKGLIGRFRPEIEALRANGLYLADSLVEAVLRAAGE